MKTWMLSAVCALGLALTGCPGEEASLTTCTTDSDCSGSEICHPTAKVCAQTCNAATDCPSSAKTCTAISSSDNRQICKCSTDALCNDGRATADLVCDQATGLCLTKGTTPTGEACTVGSCSQSGQVCNYQTDVCEAAATCSGTAQSTCRYGEFCSGTSCKDVAKPTCTNWDPSKGGRAPTWNPDTNTGPIIYEITQVSFSSDTFCTGTSTTAPHAVARVKAYTTGTFPTGKTGLSGVFYVTTNGSDAPQDAVQLMTNYSRSSDTKSAQFDLNFCPGASVNSFPIGVYFTGGNEACGQLTK